MSESHENFFSKENASKNDVDEDEEWPSIYIPDNQQKLKAVGANRSASVGKEVDSAFGTSTEHSSFNQSHLSSAEAPTRSSISKSWVGYYPEFSIRSALFGCARTARFKEREARDIEIAQRANAEVKLICKGPVLSMADKEIWEIALDIARECQTPYGESFAAPLAEFARRMGLKSQGGSVKINILESLRRLADCEVQLVQGSMTACGRLIGSVSSGGFATHITLDGNLIEPTLSRTPIFKLNGIRRRGLHSSLAMWLHDYFSTHGLSENSKSKADPKMPLRISYLKRMCGYRGMDADFVGRLREALDELKQLRSPGGLESPLLLSYSIDDKQKSSSDKWILTYSRGAERPRFEEQKAVAAPKKKKRSKQFTTNGVAL